MFGKFEATFTVTTTAQDLYWPFDSATPPGVPAGTGVSVDALITGPNRKTRAAACFFFEDPTTGEQGWRLRFAPDAAGKWSYRVRVRDAGGERRLSGGSFSVVTSAHPGFVRVSPTDGRYFEHSRGRTFLPAPGVHADTPEKIQAMSGTFNLVRTWAQASNNYAISGMRGQGGSLWSGAGGPTDTAPLGQLRGWLLPPAGQVEVKGGGIAVVAARYRLEILCRDTDTARPDISPVYITSRSPVASRPSEWAGWQYRSIDFTATNPNVFANWVYPKNDGANAVPSVIARISARALDAHSAPMGPELLRLPSPSVLQHYGQRDSARFDAMLEAAAAAGVYLKVVAFEKEDSVGTTWNVDGTFRAPSAGGAAFYGGTGVGWSEATRWLQGAYARYFAARWGWSPHIHSAEYVNEGDPYNAYHFAAAASFSRALKAACARAILVSTSCWHSQSNLWDRFAADLDYVDVHEYLGTGGGRSPRLLGFPRPSMMVSEPGNPANRVLQVVNGDGRQNYDRCPAFDPIPLVPGERFTLRGRFRVLNLAPAAAAGDVASFTANVEDAPSPGQQMFPPRGIGHKSLPAAGAADTGWIEFGGGTLTAPLGGPRWLKTCVVIYSRTGTYLFDDVRVEFPDRPGSPTYKIPGGDGGDGRHLHEDLALTMEWAWRRYTGGGGSLSRPLAKPWTWGELGVWAPTGEDPLLDADTAGQWLHELTWGCINPGAPYPMWWTKRILAAPSRGSVVAYRKFFEGVPLNNGRYCDAEPVFTTGLSGAGQVDKGARRAHVWVRNTSYTWRQVVAGAWPTPRTGTVSVKGLVSGSYTVQIWDTRAGAILSTQRLTVPSGSDVLLVKITVSTDAAIKILP